MEAIDKPIVCVLDPRGEVRAGVVDVKAVGEPDLGTAGKPKGGQHIAVDPLPGSAVEALQFIQDMLEE